MEFWKGKKVLVTGHTGFKGSWLCLWLQKLGAEVVGYALEPPTTPSLFSIAKINEKMTSIIGDIRDKEMIFNTIKTYKPEIIFHLAAQSLVRESYNNPVNTFETNVMGTVNLLYSAGALESVRVVINVTSDKCYDNKEWLWRYREIDPIGGYDPYSCSKGCSELITNSFRQSYFNMKNIGLSSVRAGNVIGGGDWAADRLVPDIIKSVTNNEPLLIRNPLSIRPWQHVLEPLNGYLFLAEKMWSNIQDYSGAWNFGPDENNILNVGELANKVLKLWNSNLKFNYLNDNQPHEAKLLQLDSTKAKLKLNWHPKLDLENTLFWTTKWYKKFAENSQNMREITFQQIEDFEMLGR